jgi:hypothetical protein
VRWFDCFVAAKKHKDETTSGDNQNTANQEQFCGHVDFPFLEFLPYDWLCPPLWTTTMKLRTGLVHLQDFSVEVGAVECTDCHFRFGIGLHLNESKPSGLTSTPVSHHLEPLNGTVLFK